MTTNKERQQEARQQEARVDRAEARAEEKRERAAEDREAVRAQEGKPAAANVTPPSVGRIVLYNGDEPCAAIITKVHSPTCVNLTAFPGTTCTEHRRDVALGTEPGTWSWPPQV